MAGIQGPIFAGTGCFHRRRLIYGFSFDNVDVQGKDENDLKRILKESFGNSREFINSVAEILKDNISPAQDLASVVHVSSEIARCGYEHDTVWGIKVRWCYGTVTESIVTGMRIHSKRWRSVSCMPDPPGFLGTAPTSGPVCLIQKKRWTTGMTQVLFSKNSPILATINAKLWFRQCLAYLRLLTWGLGSVFDTCYSLLPAYSVVTNSNFLPQASEPAMAMLVARFLIQNLQSLLFYFRRGLSVRVWWNNTRISKIHSSTSMLLGFLSFLLKLMGVSEVAFVVTQKDQSDNSSGYQDSDRDKNVIRLSLLMSPLYLYQAQHFYLCT